MTLLEMTALAGTRLQHWWELHGMATDPTPTIRQIAGDVAGTKAQARLELEAHLHETWVRLCAQEGDDDDHTL
jgi:hypothetical protein